MKTKFWNDFVFWPSAVCIGSVTVGSGLYQFLSRDDEFRNILSFLPFPFYLLFTLSYVVTFLRRNDESIHVLSRVLSCVALSMSLMTLMASELSVSYWLVVLIWSGAFYWLLCWNPQPTTLKEGDYPLWLDLEKKRGLPTDSIDKNVQIIGGTGSGKTRYVIKPFIEQTIKQGLGSFIADVKSNMTKDVIYFAKLANRVTDVKYFDLAFPELSNTCNFLYGKDPNEIANRIHTAFYYDTKVETKFYSEIASAFLNNLVSLLMLEIKVLTFQDLFLATSETGTFRIISEYCARHEKTDQARYFRDSWLNKPPRQRQDELIGLINKLQRFCNREWSHLINVRNPEIRLDEVVARSQILIFGLDASRYPDDAKPLSILAMMNLFSQLSDRFRKSSEKPFRLFLDEFYDLAYPGFNNHLNKCRGARMNVIMAHQSLGDLRNISLDFMEQVIQNARNKIFLGMDDPQTTEYCAAIFGTEEDKEARVISYDANDNVAGYAKPQVQKYRVHPNVFKELPEGEAIVKVATKKKAHWFHTTLKTASEVPEDFYWQRYLPSRGSRRKENETSIVISEDQSRPLGGKRVKKDQSDFGGKLGESSNV